MGVAWVGRMIDHTGHGDFAGFGEPPQPDFWIRSDTPNKPEIHVAFRVSSRARVDAFYHAAMAAGRHPDLKALSVEVLK